MSLLQLACNSIENQEPILRNLLTNIAHEYIIYESEGPRHFLSIKKESDIIVPEYLELQFSDLNRDNLQDIKKLVLIMEIGGNKVQQFPLSLFMNLNEPIICDSKMYINLCFDMLFGKINLIGLEYHEVKFGFSRPLYNNNELNCLSRFGIVCKQTYVDATERRLLVTNYSESFIQQLSFINVKTDVNQTSDIFHVRLPFSYISKGFFIECENVDHLNYINLQFNYVDRFNLNRFLIRSKCRKINQYLLYFHFNKNNMYNSL